MCTEDENCDLFLKLFDAKFLAKIKVSKKLHVELCMTMLKHPKFELQDGFLPKIYSIVLVQGGYTNDWSMAFINGFLEFEFYSLISEVHFLDKLQSALKFGSAEGQNLLKTALQYGK